MIFQWLNLLLLPIIAGIIWIVAKITKVETEIDFLRKDFDRHLDKEA